MSDDVSRTTRLLAGFLLTGSVAASKRGREIRALRERTGSIAIEDQIDQESELTDIMCKRDGEAGYAPET